MATYIKTSNPEKYVKILLDYSKGYHSDNRDRGYYAILVHVKRTPDGCEMHQLFVDDKRIPILVGLARRSKKTDQEAIEIWKGIRVEAIKAFAAERGIDLSVSANEPTSANVE